MHKKKFRDIIDYASNNPERELPAYDVFFYIFLKNQQNSKNLKTFRINNFCQHLNEFYSNFKPCECNDLAINQQNYNQYYENIQSKHQKNCQNKHCGNRQNDLNNENNLNNKNQHNKRYFQINDKNLNFYTNENEICNIYNKHIGCGLHAECKKRSECFSRMCDFMNFYLKIKFKIYDDSNNLEFQGSNSLNAQNIDHVNLQSLNSKNSNYSSESSNYSSENLNNCSNHCSNPYSKNSNDLHTQNLNDNALNIIILSDCINKKLNITNNAKTKFLCTLSKFPSKQLKPSNLASSSQAFQDTQFSKFFSNNPNSQENTKNKSIPINKSLHNNTITTKKLQKSKKNFQMPKEKLQKNIDNYLQNFIINEEYLCTLFFYRIFNVQKKYNIIISFLNSILQSNILKIENIYLNYPLNYNKKTIFDIMCFTGNRKDITLIVVNPGDHNSIFNYILYTYVQDCLNLHISRINVIALCFEQCALLHKQNLYENYQNFKNDILKKNMKFDRINLNNNEKWDEQLLQNTSKNESLFTKYETALENLQIINLPIFNFTKNFYQCNCQQDAWIYIFKYCYSKYLICLKNELEKESLLNDAIDEFCLIFSTMSEIFSSTR